jgi:hypothetical protein
MELQGANNIEQQEADSESSPIEQPLKPTPVIFPIKTVIVTIKG